MSLNATSPGASCVHSCTQWILLGVFTTGYEQPRPTFAPREDSTSLCELSCTSAASVGKCIVCSIFPHPDLFLDHHHLHHFSQVEGKHPLCNDCNLASFAFLPAAQFRPEFPTLCSLNCGGPRLALCNRQLGRLSTASDWQWGLKLNQGGRRERLAHRFDRGVGRKSDSTWSLYCVWIEVKKFFLKISKYEQILHVSPDKCSSGETSAALSWCHDDQTCSDINLWMNTRNHREQVYLAVNESTCGERMVLPNLYSSHRFRHTSSSHCDV